MTTLLLAVSQEETLAACWWPGPESLEASQFLGPSLIWTNWQTCIWTRWVRLATCSEKQGKRSRAPGGTKPDWISWLYVFGDCRLSAEYLSVARIPYLKCNYYGSISKNANVLRFSNRYHYYRPARSLEPLESWFCLNPHHHHHNELEPKPWTPVQ